MTQHSGPTPSTQPLPPSDDATRVRPGRGVTAETQQLPPTERGRLPFYSAVTCGSLLLALVIGVGGFLGVRSLGAGPSSPGASSPGASSPGASSPPVASETSSSTSGRQPSSAGDDEAGPSDADASPGPDADGAAADGAAADNSGAEVGGEMPEIPTGPEQAQPPGATVPFGAAEAEGYLEVTFGEVTWDAGEVIAEANMFNDPPREGHRYLLVTLEATYLGTGTFHAYVWASFEFVAEDGSVHQHTRLATPNYESGGHGQIRDGGSFSEEIVFEVPEGAPEQGHFVLNGFSRPTEEGTWVEAT